MVSGPNTSPQNLPQSSLWRPVLKEKLGVGGQMSRTRGGSNSEISTILLYQANWKMAMSWKQAEWVKACILKAEYPALFWPRNPGSRILNWSMLFIKSLIHQDYCLVTKFLKLILTSSSSTWPTLSEHCSSDCVDCGYCPCSEVFFFSFRQDIKFWFALSSYLIRSVQGTCGWDSKAKCLHLPPKIAKVGNTLTFMLHIYFI